MLDSLRTNENLRAYVRDECCENDICVEIAPDIKPEDVLILKVDDFYNSLNIQKRPPSIDCLIVIRCGMGDYKLILVELKNIKNSRGYRIDNLKAKFNTTIDDFMKTRFRDLYNANYRKVNLFFVSPLDPRRDNGLLVDTFIGLTIKFRNRNFSIDPRQPTPLIKAC